MSRGYQWASGGLKSWEYWVGESVKFYCIAFIGFMEYLKTYFTNSRSPFPQDPRLAACGYSGGCVDVRTGGAGHERHILGTYNALAHIFT